MMNQLPGENTLIWRLHADKLMLLRDNGLHTSMLGFRMVASWFNHTPPNSLDMEYAIQHIEDGLMPLRQESFGVKQWLSDDDFLLHLTRRIGNDYSFSREQLEQHFNEVCETLNRPMALEKLGLNNQEIAYLLVLREAMHHLDFLSMRYVG